MVKHIWLKTYFEVDLGAFQFTVVIYWNDDYMKNQSIKQGLCYLKITIVQKINLYRRDQTSIWDLYRNYAAKHAYVVYHDVR